jgi:hypothetical protein
VVAVVGVATADDGEVVDHGTDAGEDIRDLDATLPALLEREGGLHEIAGGGVRGELFAGQGLAVLAGEFRLGIEGVDLRDAAVEEQENDVFGLGREMGFLFEGSG